MKRYAFIDVQNTETTASQILGFVIDWRKLHDYLKTHWNCEKIFFYSGIQNGNGEIFKEYKMLSDLGYIVHAKPYFIYKNRDTLIKINCPKCNNEISQKIDRGVKWKSNCDVEMSVDVINNIQSNVEFLIFTGDGDFEYLIRDAINKGVKIYIVSNAKKNKIGPRYFSSRFSTKLRNLINEKRGLVNFINLNDWKIKIQKR